MAKRGQRRPWKMRFVWPNGISDTESFTTEDAARFAAEQQAKRVGPDGDRCTVEVFARP